MVVLFVSQASHHKDMCVVRRGKSEGVIVLERERWMADAIGETITQTPFVWVDENGKHSE